MLRFYPQECSKDSSNIALVLVHGWGLGSVIWESVLPQLVQQRDVYTLAMKGYFPADQKQDCVLPDEFIVVGFSLGGVVASLGYSDLLGEIDLRSNMKGLVTVGTNARFVANNNWPKAMPSDAFNVFSNQLNQGEDAVKKVLTKFSGLQCQSSPGMREEIRFLREQAKLGAECGQTPDQMVLNAGLTVLASADLRRVWKELSVPSLHHFGRYDQLVPVEAASDIRTQLNLSVEIFEKSAHQPFVSEPERWLASINRFADNLLKDTA